MMREPDLVMSVRRTLTILVASVLVGGVSIPAHAQSAPPKVATKPAAAKPAPTAAASVTGGAEPTLVGQFGTWGPYPAAPNGKKVCFALAKPASSKTNP